MVVFRVITVLVPIRPVDDPPTKIHLFIVVGQINADVGDCLTDQQNHYDVKLIDQTDSPSISIK